jgi:fructose-bisphosphate aldolase class II
MSLVTLEEILIDARKRKYAVGAFNTVNLEMLRAVIKAAEQESSPVIIAQAEVHLPYGELEILAPAVIKAAKDAKVTVAVHFDHGITFENIVKAFAASPLPPRTTKRKL